MTGSKRSFAELSTGAAVLIVAAGFLVYALVNTGRGVSPGTHLSARFDNIGALTTGSDVRMSGVKVGSVTGVAIDPKSYQAILTFNVRPDIKLSVDSSAAVSTGGLLGGAFLTLSPGGQEGELKDGGVITVTQSATNLEDLLGKFIFNVGSLADATQKSLKQNGANPDDLPK